LFVNEKIFSISIFDPKIPRIWWAKKPLVGNRTSYFPHHWRRHLISLGSTW
jgi:hypothetical protein